MTRFALFLFSLCAQFSLWADASAPERDDQMVQVVLMVGVTMTFFYIILWRPEQKRRQELDKQRGDLQKGDRVTAMGIIGSVFRTQKETVILKMIDGSKIEMLKAAITDIHPKESATSEEMADS